MEENLRLLIIKNIAIEIRNAPIKENYCVTLPDINSTIMLALKFSIFY